MRTHIRILVEHTDSQRQELKTKEDNMGIRDNNGVKSKVYSDYGNGSENRGSSQAGKVSDEGGLKVVGGEVPRNGVVSQDMRAITGSRGSSGTVKNNGGIGTINEQAGMSHEGPMYED